MGTEAKVNRCVFDLKDLVTNSVTSDLLESRTVGSITIDDASLNYVLRLVSQAVEVAANKTATRISKVLAEDNS
jgi:hypothetical protein